MPTKEELLEAAHLARMVGTHMHQVDKYTVESSGHQANKIDMHKFVAPLMGQQIQQDSTYGNVNPAIEKAYEGLNDLALQKFPDPTPSVVPMSDNTNNNNTSIPTSDFKAELLTRSDIDSIRNSLNNISKTMSAILKHITQNK